MATDPHLPEGLPEEIGPYRIEKMLGRGAMGSVYLARDSETGEKVAIKVMAPEMGTSETALARFEREMDALAPLQHPNIVRLKVAGHHGDSRYYVTEYIEGRSLRDYLHDHGPLSQREAAIIVCKLAQALAYAHNQGVLHRDL